MSSDLGPTEIRGCDLSSPGSALLADSGASTGETACNSDASASPDRKAVHGGGLSLRVNFCWTVVGNVVYAGCQWAMLMVVAKLGTPQLVGRFSLGLAISAPVVTLAACQLRLVQATDAKGDYRFSDYLSARLTGLVPAMLMIFGISMLSHYNMDAVSVILAIGFAKAFESISDVYYGLSQQNERMDLVSKSKMMKGVFSLAALGVGLYLTHDIFWGSVGLAVMWAILLLAYDIPNGTRLLRGSSIGAQSGDDLREAVRPHLHWRRIGKLMWLALPLGLAGMLNSLRTNIPRYYVEGYLGEANLGFFSAIAYLMIAVLAVVYAIGECAAPRLGRYYVSGNIRGFVSLLTKLTVLGILSGGAGVVVSMVAGRQILSVLFTPEYAKGADILVLVMVATGVTAVAAVLNYAMTATRSISVQMPLFALVCVVTAAVCMCCVPTMGLRGAAFALIAGAMTHLACGGAVVARALYGARHEPNG